MLNRLSAISTARRACSRSGCCLQHFLDEELAMPSLATWWCGQERERRYVLDHLDEVVVRRVSSSINGFMVGGGAHQVSVAVDVSPRPGR
ncbi:MAG TPA: circularly permuted type 2 ATP-grasp protein [Gammaproteobacteria bacterium]|nr:circularly permuted type 2 ATP-grasp protein [Gammaproteobacteria bacterium]